MSETSLIQRVNFLKGKYDEAIKMNNKSGLKCLENDLLTFEEFQRDDIILGVLKDIQNMIESNKSLHLENSIQLTNSKDNNLIISIFDIPYAPSMGIDACFYTNAVIDPEIYKYKTNANPIFLKEWTTGFDPEHMVAIFPENHIGVTATSKDKIFYLVNKFAWRHFHTTQKIISRCVESNSLKSLRSATYSDIEDAVVYWVYLHEYHHQEQGNLRIPEYLSLKSSKVLAGLEELRVDIGSMLLCLKQGKKFKRNNFYLFEFILSERLLRYGVDGVKLNKNNVLVPSYDALSSYMFYNLLIERNGISIINNQISIEENIVEVLEEIYNEINTVELQAKNSIDNMAKSILTDYTSQCLSIDNALKYTSHPFYDLMREQVAYQI